MKKNFQRVAFWGGIVMSASLALSSCDKDYESSNGVGSEATEGEDYLVPFFEVAKGDSISKDIYRAKPYSEDEASDEVVTSEDDTNSEALRYLYTGTTKYKYITGIQARAFNSASEAPSYYYSCTFIGGQVVPFYKFNYDLNAGSGGKHIYFYYCPEQLVDANAVNMRDRSNSLLRDITDYSARKKGDYLSAVKSDAKRYYGGYDYEWHHEGTDGCANVISALEASAFPSWAYKGTGKQTDLNEGAGGKYIYLFGSSNCKHHSPITSIAISEKKNVSGYRRVSNDLNDGAGGKYIYLFAKHSF
ncbi:MAG: hypothetical protein MJZ33_08535 [Paludibacteraceae bacterium]|nr:hypothetical protein [Paludibacteraceae bacterium]